MHLLRLEMSIEQLVEKAIDLSIQPQERGGSNCDPATSLNMKVAHAKVQEEKQPQMFLEPKNAGIR